MPELDLFKSWDISFETTKEALLTLIKHTIPAVPNSPALPALGNFYVSANASGLQFIATDINTAILSVLKQDVMVSDQGRALLPARRLYSIVRELEKGEKLAIGVSDNSAILISDSAQWTLALQRASSFPALNLKAKLVKFPRAVLLDALERTKFAASLDPSKPNLTVIHIENSKLTACDGTRLQQIKFKQEFPLNISLSIDKIDTLLRALNTSTSPYISIGENDKYIILATDLNVVALAKVTIIFPNVEKAILKPAMENKLELRFDRQVMISALRKAHVTSDRDSGLINLAIASSGLEVRSKDRAGNSSYVKVQGSWSSTSRVLTFSYSDMLGLLRSHVSDNVSIMLGEDTKTKKFPLLLRDSELGLTSVLSQAVDY